VIRGAAPQIRRRLVLVALATSALTGAAPVAAHVDGSARPAAAAPSTLRAIALDARAATGFTRGRATSLRRSGVNTVVLAGWPQPSAAARQKAAAVAVASGLFVVSPDYARSVASAGGACAGERPGFVCAVFASSVREGAALANVHGPGIVVVRLAGPGQLRALAGKHTRRIVAVVPLQAERRFDSVQWLKALRLVDAAPTLDLAVQPVGATAAPAFASYLQLLGGGSGAGRKTIASARAPAAPEKVIAAGATATSVTLSWSAVDDAVEYGIYRDGAQIGRAVGESFVVAGLACDRSYAFAVDAANGAGRSDRTGVTARTAACGSVGNAPAAPADLHLTGNSLTTISLAWSPSAGAVSYGLYVNGAQAGSAAGPNSTFTLACGTAFSLGVDAASATGLRSPVTTVIAETYWCAGGGGTGGGGTGSTGGGSTGGGSGGGTPGDTQPPSVPQGQSFSSIAQTSITMRWNASSDNVGIAGYRAFLDGALRATTGSGQLSYTYTGLSCGTTYQVALEAYDAAGNTSDRNQAAGSVSSLACTGSPPPPPSPPPNSSSANVWVDTSGGSCARQSTAGAYVDAQACSSLQAAYNAAQPGDTVNIADGTYTSQPLAAGTKSVAFRAAGPGRPRFGKLISAAANITVSGIQIENRADFDGPCPDPDNAVLYPCGSNQTFDNVVIDGLNAAGNDHGVRGVGNGFVLKNSEIRNLVNSKGFEGGSDDMVIENNYFHDITVNDSQVHNECMYVDGGDRAVFRGNRFIGCPTMALFFTNWNGGAPYSNVLVENNVFAHTLDDTGDWHGSCSFKIGSGANNQNTVVGWIVRYNTFEVAPCVDHTPAGGDTGAAQWYGNLGGISVCVTEFVYRYNVGQTCGGTGDFAVGLAVNDAAHPNQVPFYANAPGGDFHLIGGAAAINRADPGNFPAVDKDGNRRPVGAAPDAGAYEYAS
jgi:chitodextrinase